MKFYKLKNLIESLSSGATRFWIDSNGRIIYEDDHVTYHKDILIKHLNLNRIPGAEEYEYFDKAFKKGWIRGMENNNYRGASIEASYYTREVSKQALKSLYDYILKKPEKKQYLFDIDVDFDTFNSKAEVLAFLDKKI